MERVQSQFLICRTGGRRFASVGLILAHVGAIESPCRMYGSMLGCISLILAYVGPMLGLCWGMLGLRWDQIGLRWAILGRVGTRSGSCWAILRVVVGLYLGLEHFSVVDFCPCNAFAKNTANTNKNAIFMLCCWSLWCFFLVMFFAFLGRMLHSGYAGLIESSCWAMFEPYWVVIMSYWVMLGNVEPALGPYWANVAPFWTILEGVLAGQGEPLCWAVSRAHVEPFWVELVRD